ncbi:MAG: MATE family efflux transporter [Deltaproteobacteria bacterium]|nr:MATE family efflux transporter [Deltaproteobacteria bacterium]
MKYNTRSDMLAREKIGRLLWKLSTPAIIGMMVHAFYNIVDTIFIGRFAGTLGIGGISIVFPIQMIIIATGITIGIGGASVISRRMGEGDQEGASLALGNIIILSICCGLICFLIGFIVLNPLLILFGANEALLPYSRDYLSVILMGAPMIVFSMASNSAARAEGNAKMAMNTMLLGGILNILLDPVFIVVLGLGVKGAAIATVISITVSCLFLIKYFLSGKSDLLLRLQYMRFRPDMAREIFAVGSSEFVRSVAMSLTSAIFNNTLRSIGGETPIAVFGIMFRVMSLFFMPIIGISQGAQPIIGFNYGAKQHDRVRRGLLLANLSTTVIALIGFLMFFVFSEFIFRIFSSDPELITIGKTALRFFAVGLPLVGYQHISISLFQALGKGRPALFLTLARQVFFLIPMVLILPRFFGLKGVWLSFPVTDVISFFVTFSMVTYTIRNLHLVKGKA